MLLMQYLMIQIIDIVVIIIVIIIIINSIFQFLYRRSMYKHSSAPLTGNMEVRKYLQRTWAKT